MEDRHGLGWVPEQLLLLILNPASRTWLTESDLLTKPNNTGYATLPDPEGDGEQTLTHWQIGNRSLTHKANSLKKVKVLRSHKRS